MIPQLLGSLSTSLRSKNLHRSQLGEPQAKRIGREPKTLVCWDFLVVRKLMVENNTVNQKVQPHRRPLLDEGQAMPDEMQTKNWIRHAAVSDAT